MNQMMENGASEKHHCHTAEAWFHIVDSGYHPPHLVCSGALPPVIPLTQE